jgi:hypothetical protein
VVYSQQRSKWRVLHLSDDTSPNTTTPIIIIIIIIIITTHHNPHYNLTFDVRHFSHLLIIYQ